MKKDKGIVKEKRDEKGSKGQRGDKKGKQRGHILQPTASVWSGWHTRS